MKFYVRLAIALLLLALVLYAFWPQAPFSSQRWRYKEDGIYPYREEMLKRLLREQQLKGMTLSELQNILGRPDSFVKNGAGQIIYNIITEYGNRIDPVYSKDLLISFNTDSLVVNYAIQEKK